MKLLISFLIITTINSLPLVGKQLTVKREKSGFLEIKPPSSTKVSDIYIDQTEILNIHWLEYTYYKSLDLSEEEYLQLLPDSINNWFRVPQHRYEPVTLISYEQALGYCQWRSEVVSDRYGVQIVYRLPTVEEWDQVASTLLKEKEKQILRDLKKQQALMKKIDTSFFLQHRFVPVINNKVYHLFSNVSEMTASKGIAKGSNNHKIETETKLMKTFQYTKPNAYLGFRCVAEVLSDSMNNKMSQLIDDKKVTISLEAMDIDVIPKQIGLLTKVRELEICLSTPEENWTVLPPLSWFENRVLSPPFREIPESVRNLKKLKSLTMMNLDIHEVPEFFSQIDNIRYLDLSFNKLDLTKELPKLLKMKNLKELRVIGNHYDEEQMKIYSQDFPKVKLIYQVENK